VLRCGSSLAPRYGTSACVDVCFSLAHASCATSCPTLCRRTAHSLSPPDCNACPPCHLLSWDSRWASTCTSRIAPARATTGTTGRPSKSTLRQTDVGGGIHGCALPRGLVSSTTANGAIRVSTCTRNLSTYSLHAMVMHVSPASLCKRSVHPIALARPHCVVPHHPLASTPFAHLSSNTTHHAYSTTGAWLLALRGCTTQVRFEPIEDNVDESLTHKYIHSGPGFYVDEFRIASEPFTIVCRPSHSHRMTFSL
jgi:hypothetical protein